MRAVPQFYADLASATIRRDTMPDWLPIVLFPLAYLALMKWVLPRFGVAT